MPSPSQQPPLLPHSPLGSSASIAAPEPSPTTASATDLSIRSRGILIVDSCDHGRSAVAELLRDCSYPVLEASSGVEGLRVALERSPALIIAELWPFFSGGLQMIEELRKHAQTARIPVLVMTAADLPDYQQRAVLSGCSGYLAKPCPSERLLAEVRRIILERMAGPWNQ